MSYFISDEVTGAALEDKCCGDDLKKDDMREAVTEQSLERS